MVTRVAGLRGKGSGGGEGGIVDSKGSSGGCDSGSGGAHDYFWVFRETPKVPGKFSLILACFLLEVCREVGERGKEGGSGELGRGTPVSNRDPTGI